MAEESERVKQHTYQLNSNLVIQRDRTSRLEIGPSDEVKTLSKIAPEDLQGMFGSSVKQSAPPIEKRKAKKRPKQYSTKRLKGDVLEEQETFGYKPKTLQTKRVYDVLINIVSKMFPGDSHDLIKSCTDLALETLKNENLKLSEKKKKLEKLLKSGALGEDQFSEIFGLTKKITDFDADDDAANNEDIDVPIEFDDDADFREVAEPDESENSSSESDEEMNRSGKPETENSIQKAEDDKTGNGDVKKENATPIKKGHESGFEGARSALREADLRQIREAERQEKSKMVLSTTAAFDIGQEEISLVASSGDQIDLKEIGAYWLQKKISVFFKDPLEAQERAQKVLATIERERDLRFCENKLVDLLGFEAFDFIKVLIKNRFEILYCTKLAQSSEAERKKLESAMKSFA